MKDFTIQFSLKNLFRETQKEVARIQTWVQSSSVLGGISALVGSGKDSALIVGAIGLGLNIILHCIYLEEKK